MVDKWIKEIKTKISPENLGMILVHNGIVRASSKDGKPVKYMNLSFDAEKLDLCVNKLKRCDGIEDIRVWINKGTLNVGDDIMYVLVAGRFRTDVLPVLQELLSTIKKEIVTEKEVYLWVHILLKNLWKFDETLHYDRKNIGMFRWYIN